MNILLVDCSLSILLFDGVPGELFCKVKIA